MKALPVRAGTAFFLLLPVILLCFSLAGCSLERAGGRKDRTEVTWETVEEADVPEDMKKEIRNRKRSRFRLPGAMESGSISDRGTAVSPQKDTR